MVTAGVIGIGRIGRGVSLCLARAGMIAATYDVRADAADGLEGVPAVCASPADLARRSDVVVIAVVDAAQVRAVLEGPGGVLAAARSDLSIVLLSTVALHDLAALRSLSEAAGVPLIDSGVGGGPAAAEKGIVSMVGATEEALARVMPVLEGFSRRVVRMGGPGAGMAAKIARNAVVLGSLRAGFEGAALAHATGVDIAQLAQVFDDTGDAGIGPLMFMRRSADPAGNAAEKAYRENVRVLMLKDVEAALELGNELGIELPLMELTRQTSREITGAPH